MKEDAKHLNWTAAQSTKILLSGGDDGFISQQDLTSFWQHFYDWVNVLDGPANGPDKNPNRESMESKERRDTRLNDAAETETHLLKATTHWFSNSCKKRCIYYAAFSAGSRFFTQNL